MQIKLISGTPRPERLVALAARNDYRRDGVIDHSFAEIMHDVTLDETVVDELRDEWFDADDLARTDPFEAMPEAFRTEAQVRSLIKHLMSQGHWGVFEHPYATVAIEGVTRTAMAQITRHRHFSFDIMSLRYVGVEPVESVAALEDRFEIPEEFTADEVVSREGVDQIDLPAGDRLDRATEVYAHAMAEYAAFVEAGVPKEEARKLLPLATKVNIVMSGNARAWMHLLNIRGKANVQGEARAVADGVMREMKDWMPYTFRRYDDMLPLTLNP